MKWTLKIVQSNKHWSRCGKFTKFYNEIKFLLWTDFVLQIWYLTIFTGRGSACHSAISSIGFLYMNTKAWGLQIKPFNYLDQVKLSIVMVANRTCFWMIFIRYFMVLFKIYNQVLWWTFPYRDRNIEFWSHGRIRINSFAFELEFK